MRYDPHFECQREEYRRADVKQGRFSPRERLRQSRVKIRILAARNMRAWQRGDVTALWGCLAEREILDAIRLAYAAGFRDGRSDAQHGASLIAGATEGPQKWPDPK